MTPLGIDLGFIRSRYRANDAGSQANASRRSLANDFSSLAMPGSPVASWTRPGEEASDAEPAAWSSSKRQTGRKAGAQSSWAPGRYGDRGSRVAEGMLAVSRYQALRLLPLGTVCDARFVARRGSHRSRGVGIRVPSRRGATSYVSRALNGAAGRRRHIWCRRRTRQSP